MVYEAENGDMSIVVLGDAMISRRMSVYREEPFAELVNVLRAADVSVANLEFLFHDYESSWEWSHGTYTAAQPRLLDELTWLGIDSVFTANNHSYDYSEGGFLATLRHLSDRGIPHAGGGVDIDHARAPAYVDAARGRVAVLSAASTFSDVSRAGPGRADFPGRPGINALRTKAVHHVTRDLLDALHVANRELGLEAVAEAREAFGFTGRSKPIDKSVAARFLGKEFRLAESCRTEVTVDEEDMGEITAWIRAARKHADWVVYGLHTHESGEDGEFHGSSRTSPPEFMVDFAHRAIDAGCDVVAGHGPHYLRGIEIYRGRPIFYSLGNFIMQNETVQWLPHEAYRRFGLGPEHRPPDFFEERSEGETRGFPVDPVFWRGLVPVCRFAGGRLSEIVLHPIDLGFGRPIPQRGRPMLARGDTARSILEWVRDLSAPFGTEVEIQGDVARIRV